jgi:hypothetical protein
METVQVLLTLRGLAPNCLGKMQLCTDKKNFMIN